MTGRDGADIIIPLPPGTIVRDVESGEVVKDFSHTTEWVYLEGGRGGKGNWHFRSSTRQAPRIAQPGRPGLRRRITCELKLIADIGLVGLPNAGKSTLLSVLTKARPKIAAYPFTTLVPNLGVLEHKGRQVVIADIPGIIEDASRGAGLGVSFLKHIARTRLLAFIIEAGGERTLGDYAVLAKEITSFAADLAKRKKLVVISKADQGGAAECAAAFAEKHPGVPTAIVSSKTGEGIDALKDLFIRLTGGTE